MRNTLRRHPGDTHAPHVPALLDGDDVWAQEHTRQRFQDALDAFHGPEARLERLAEAADARALALREAHEAQHGARAGYLAVPQAPQAPQELRRDATRQPVGAWRYLDDAFAMLAETGRDAGASPLEHASAYMEIASASRSVAEELTDKRYAGVEAICSFCGERATDGRQTLVSEQATICEPCVEACSDLLERKQRRGSRRRRLLAR